MSSAPWAPQLHPVVNALLGREVLPRSAQPFELVSAAIALRMAVLPPDKRSPLLFLLPQGTDSTARVIAAGLLVGSYAHEHGAGRVPPGEVRALLKGSVLFVTQSVSQCMEALEAVRLATSTPLTSLWKVLSLGSGPAASATHKHKVYVSNPGWVLKRLGSRRLSAVIIDATHPRTHSRLSELVQAATHASDLCVIVAPAITGREVNDLGIQSSRGFWLWEPAAQCRAAKELHEVSPRGKCAPHALLVCPDDELNDALEAVYAAISEAKRLAKGRRYDGLSQAWTLASRLAGLAVPLTQFEERASISWHGSFRDRLRALEGIQGQGAARDATWPAILQGIRDLYQRLVARQEPPKFWTLATAVDDAIRGGGPIRLAVSSEVERQLLRAQLPMVVDDLGRALEGGDCEILTFADEARAIAAADDRRTITATSRPWTSRHLNLYPQYKFSQVVYPCEEGLVRASLQRQYDEANALQDARRLDLLESLNLTVVWPITAATVERPEVFATRVEGGQARTARLSVLDASFDLDELAQGADGVWESASAHQVLGDTSSGDVVEVLYQGGDVGRYRLEESIDVIFAEAESTHRVRVEELKPGMRVVRFVDGRYDSFFDRTKEAMESKLPPYERAMLGLWESAKAHLSDRFDTKRDLHAELQRRGLESSYGTFCSWFRAESEAAAPQRYLEFEPIAEMTGVFGTDEERHRAFECIQRSRGRNRRLGRKLHAVLRALYSQEGYEEALENLRKVAPDLADVYAAIDVATVESVRKL